MSYLSKHKFESAIKEATCQDLVHMNSDRCFKEFVIFLAGTVKGISGFFLVMYAAQHLLLRKKITRTEFIKISKYYVRSLLFCATLVGIAIASFCVQSNTFGRFNYYSTGLGTGTTIGIFSFLSPKSRLPVEATYFSIMTLQTCIRFLSTKGMLPRCRAASVPYFMICNAITMQLLWNKQNTDKPYNITWFFKPYCKKTESKNKLCSHKESCFDDCLKTTIKYLLIGGGMSFVKLLLKMYRKKETNILGQLDSTYLKYPLFLSSYVGIQKGIHCLLNKWAGVDRGEHAFIAGLLSGMVSIIKPSLSLPTASTVLIVKALMSDVAKKTNLNISYLTMIPCFAILIHFYYFNDKIVPSFFKNMLSAITNKRGDQIKHNLRRIVQQNSKEVVIF